ncbi:hypothetical protein [uncultured Sphingomonas sp.]|uniref:hypothetical protein n=1 Tax=uncultured Sphingomonas sp. TaxID=158754 RepID=UPI0035CC47F5
MAVVDPEHLFEQADRSIAAPPAGPPRQADLRRAVSAACYGLFHFIVTALADEFVGRTKRSDSRYTLVYRSVDHRALKTLCAQTTRPGPTPRYLPFAPTGGFGTNIQAFSMAIVELQEKRHNADCDPSMRFGTSDAQLAISTARTALRRFGRASSARRKAFLTLLLCPPR